MSDYYFPGYPKTADPYADIALVAPRALNWQSSRPQVGLIPEFLKQVRDAIARTA